MGNRCLRRDFYGHNPVPGLSSVRGRFRWASELVSGKAWLLAWGVWTGLMLGRRRSRSDRLCAEAHALDKSACPCSPGGFTGERVAASLLLQRAGSEIDRDFGNIPAARLRALCLRHVVEQVCTDTMLRFGRAFGPRPLAFDSAISRLYHDLSLYIRQSHAESDLEELGRLSLATSEGCRPTNAKTEQPG